VRSTKQSVGIIVGGFCPQHLYNYTLKIMLKYGLKCSIIFTI
jgi:hypothetical protein